MIPRERLMGQNTGGGGEEKYACTQPLFIGERYTPDRQGLWLVGCRMPTFWWIKQDGISVIKFEAAQLHFLSNIFVALAVIVA